MPGASVGIRLIEGRAHAAAFRRTIGHAGSIESFDDRSDRPFGIAAPL
jgi:hypothetical protein